MSRRNYPRFDSAKKLKPGTQEKCQAKGCNQQAEGWVCMQFSYFRGEDEGVYTCREHAKGATRDPEAFCARFPPEAWK